MKGKGETMAEESYHKCAFCGGVMSKNPHPNAGKPATILEVGAAFECIPCLVKSRHQWAERALKAETSLDTVVERHTRGK
jgi:hypothetical protein